MLHLLEHLECCMQLSSLCADQQNLKMVTENFTCYVQDFNEAADALGSMNLSEGWSSLSLRSRHSESGAQSAERRDNRGSVFVANTSGFRAREQDKSDDDDEEQPFPSAQVMESFAAGEFAR